MENKIKSVDDQAQLIKVYGKDTMGCIRHERDVMITFTRENESYELHDWFLTTSQAERLIKDLQHILERNKEK